MNPSRKSEGLEFTRLAGEVPYGHSYRRAVVRVPRPPFLLAAAAAPYHVDCPKLTTSADVSALPRSYMSVWTDSQPISCRRGVVVSEIR